MTRLLKIVVAALFSFGLVGIAAPAANAATTAPAPTTTTVTAPTYVSYGWDWGGF